MPWHYQCVCRYNIDPMIIYMPLKIIHGLHILEFHGMFVATKVDVNPCRRLRSTHENCLSYTFSLPNYTSKINRALFYQPRPAHPPGSPQNVGLFRSLWNLKYYLNILEMGHRKGEPMWQNSMNVEAILQVLFGFETFPQCEVSVCE